MRILIRSDDAAWAFARRQQNYAAHRPEGWHVVTATNADPRSGKNCDGVLLLDCTASRERYPGIPCAKLIASHAWLHDFDQNDWRTRGCNYYRCRSQLVDMLGDCDVVAVYNTEQMQAMVDAGVTQRIVLCPYSVDCSVFKPAVRERREKIRLGWNSQVSGGLNSFKGVRDCLVPLIAELGKEVEWDVLTTEAGSCLNTEQLVAWYNSIDLYAVTSSGEGGPQGPFEAAACGAVVVGTSVGQIADWAELAEARLVVPTYSNANEARETVRQMASRIRELIRDRDTLEATANYLTANIRLKYNAEVECPKQLVDLFGT